jgi:hypothetical protein
VTALWAIADSTPAGLLDFPNATTDVVLHLAISAVSAAVVMAQLRRDRGPKPATA